jgi:hypothetical protein
MSFLTTLYGGGKYLYILLEGLNSYDLTSLITFDYLKNWLVMSKEAFFSITLITKGYLNQI